MNIKIVKKINHIYNKEISGGKNSLNLSIMYERGDVDNVVQDHYFMT